MSPGGTPERAGSADPAARTRARGKPTTTWQLYQALAATWASMAITNEDAAARTDDPDRAELFRNRANRARNHAQRLQAQSERLRGRCR